AAQTSKYVFEKLKHITGLDPAKPLFVSAAKLRRLDQTDAEFVDVIHTDTMQYGVLRQVGHADFYPNFGKLEQPGCEDADNITTCNHNRAPALYAESIMPDHKFWALSSEYPRKVVLMGYEAPLNHGTFFLNTNSEFPFALNREESIAGAELGFNQMKKSFAAYVDKALETAWISQFTKSTQVKARTLGSGN
ncbi:hypothetical protein AWZ03_015061, partial [Drosophila navojoa]